MKETLPLGRIFCLLIFILTSLNTLHAQDKVFGTWYFKSPDGQLSSRMTISENVLLYERYESYNVETPYWKEDKKLTIVFQKPSTNSYLFSGEENGRYYGGEFLIDESGTTLYLYEMRENSGSSEESIQKLKDKPLRKELSKVSYSKERLEEIEAYPSLDELKKEQLVEMMNHVFEYEKEMAAFETNDRLISRIGRNVMNRKLIDMKFDPDKPTNGYYMKRFADDPDIKLLLEKQVYFKMY